MITARRADSEQPTRERARDSALRLLARREHSRAELQRKLASRGLDGEGIETVLDSLEAQGCLCDERFADSFIRARMSAGYGQLRIDRDLKSRGVASELIEAALVFDDATWEGLAERVKTKKFGTEAPQAYPDWAKQARFLQTRGFTNEQIRRVLARSPNDN